MSQSVRTNQALVDGTNKMSNLRPDVQWIDDGLVHIADVNISGGSNYHPMREAIFKSLLGDLFGGYTPLP